MALQDKVIIVTGAAAGLGREYSLRLAREGAKLAIADVRDCSETAERVQAAGGQVIALGSMGEACHVNGRTVPDRRVHTVAIAVDCNGQRLLKRGRAIGAHGVA